MIQLTPTESADFNRAAGYYDGFVAGARAFAEHMKKKKVEEILAARKPAQPPPTEDQNGNQ